MIAALALPTSAMAESYWLVLLYGKSFDQNGAVAAALEKIQMNNMADCQKEGSNWLSSKTIKATRDKGFHCVRGK